MIHAVQIPAMKQTPEGGCRDKRNNFVQQETPEIRKQKKKKEETDPWFTQERQVLKIKEEREKRAAHTTLIALQKD